MTTVKLTTFRVDGQLFGLPVERVQEVTRYHAMTPVPMAPPALVNRLSNAPIAAPVVPGPNIRSPDEFVE